MQGLSARSQKLIELLPVDENEKEMQMMPSMRTNYGKMDQMREHILDSGQDLIDAIKQHVERQQLVQAFQQIINITYHTFQEEEKEMDSKNYETEKKDAHKEQHLLLRQRLTSLGDHLRGVKGQSEAVKSVVKKILSKLFSKHFIDDDVAFAEEILEKIKKENLSKKENIIKQKRRDSIQVKDGDKKIPSLKGGHKQQQKGSDPKSGQQSSNKHIDSNENDNGEEKDGQ
ncbi:MAG: hypothetical protein EZS28_020558 [Streblomastix strix]|uniref:Hemerythrin-like domain-containing protein n=1 Tax=Streblomastix strix TaxID=222440 RepID=A0A5J4VNR4_9EUKA|nr:MAG: hypothetical protein EZS28_020558 [Streblomastix strix]